MVTNFFFMNFIRFRNWTGCFFYFFYENFKKKNCFIVIFVQCKIIAKNRCSNRLYPFNIDLSFKETKNISRFIEDVLFFVVVAFLCFTLASPLMSGRRTQ